MSFLSDILPEVEKRVELLKKNPPRVEPTKRRSLRRAIEKAPAVPVVAEIKRASPSAGEIKPEGDPLEIGSAMVRGGAIGLSVLTEPKFFRGDLSFLPLLRKLNIPLLRKDFIIDEIQLQEAAAFGADAVLLIVKILGEKTGELLDVVRELGMEALVEVTSEREVEIAKAAGAKLVGINNRDLETLKVDLRRTEELAPLVSEKAIVVSESGIEGPEDVRRVLRAGADAVLVGTAIMKSGDIEGKVRELVEAGRW
ncbi:MAG: indole-3-glycerol-phosphate synthase [Candidatus Hadarchaeales archaeon]